MSRPCVDETYRNPLLYYLNESAVWVSDQLEFAVKHPSTPQLDLNRTSALPSLLKRWFFGNRNETKLLQSFYVNRYAWEILLSPSGSHLLLMKDNTIELRTSLTNNHKRDHQFENLLMQLKVDSDPHLNWRKLFWSENGCYFGYASSYGSITIFDIHGAKLGTIEPPFPESLVHHPLVGCFIESSANDSHEFTVLAVHMTGLIRLIHVIYRGPNQPLIQNFLSTLDITAYISGPILSVSFASKVGILVVGAVKPVNPPNSASQSFKNGIVYFRRLNEIPYIKATMMTEEDVQMNNHGRYNFTKMFKLSNKHVKSTVDGILRLKISPDSRHLVSLSTTGCIKLWSFPSGKLLWSMTNEKQPYNESNNPMLEERIRFSRAMPRILPTVPDQKSINVEWWGTEDLIIARQDGCVSLLSINDKSSRMGDSPEWFEPFCQITHGLEDVFFVFECESRRKRKHSDDHASDTEFSLLEETDEDVHSLSDSLSYYIWNNTVYYMKRIFSVRQDEPLRKRMRLAELNYKLICFKSTTPEELFDRKIADEEYGEALRLALKYGLDTDIVYQKQWQKSKMTQAAIEDFLTKISKRNWILHECLERVPEDVDSMRSLLEFGLQATDVDALYTAGQSDCGQLVLTTASRWLPSVASQSSGTYLNPSEEKELMNKCEREYKLQVLENIDFSKLNIIQKELLKTRRRLLSIIDKLDAFESILGGRHRAPDRYKSEEFSLFRQASPLNSTLKYAKEGNYDAVDIMFSNFSSVLNEHRLAVLWNIPETEDPKIYSFLLPELGSRLEDSEVIPLSSSSSRENDWCENSQFTAFYEFPDDTDQTYAKQIYIDEPLCAEFRSDYLTRSILSDWFSLRAQEIDRRSRQTDNALTLISLGMERGLDGLKDLYHDLSQLHMLIYDCRIDNPLTLEQYTAMQNIDKIRLMMSHTNGEMFIKHLCNWLLPFVESIEKKMNFNRSGKKLLREYLMEVNKSSLKYILNIMKDRSSGSLNHPWIKNPEFIAQLCIDILSESEICDEYNVSDEILKLIPRGIRCENSSQNAELESKYEGLSQALNALKILSRYGIHQSFHYVNKIKDDPDAVHRMMTELIYKEIKRLKQQLQKENVCKMVSDLQILVTKFFKCIHPKVLLKITIEGLLLSSDLSKINLACQFIEVKNRIEPLSSKEASESSVRLSFNEACESIAFVAKEYFDSAINSKDDAIDFARKCLSLIETKDQSIEDELHFISALEFLEDNGLSILPASLRKNKQRGQLLKKVLDFKENLYQKFDPVLNAAVHLKIKSLKEDSQGEALRYIIQAALKRSDLKTAMIAARSIVNRCYAPGWQECLSVANHKDCYKSKSRLDLCQFAVSYCPPDELPHCIGFCNQARAELLAVQNFPEHVSTERRSGDIIKQGKEVLYTMLQTSTNTLRLVGTSLVGLDVTPNSSRKHDPTDLVLDYFYSQADDENWIKRLEDYSGPNKLLDLLYIVGVTSLSLHHEHVSTPKDDDEDSFTTFMKSLSDVKQPLYQQLFKETWRHDSILALLFALRIDDVPTLESLLKEMPSSEFNIYFATLLFALRILRRVDWRPDPTSTTMSCEYLITSAENVKQVVDDCRLDEEIRALVRYKTSYDDYTQAKRLQAISSSVDLARFTNDASYKEETILGLCMTDDLEQFQFALTLVDRYKIDNWEANVTFYEYLLLESGFSTKELRKLISEVNLMDTLQKDKDKFHDRMAKLYELMDGTQYNKLLFFFSAYSDTESVELDGVKISVHKKVVNKLKSAAPHLNYKQFVHPPASTTRLEVTKPHLSTSNVHVIAKVLTLISASGGAEASQVYSTWARFIFWHGERQSSNQPKSGNAAELSTTEEWIKRFEQSLDYVNRLQPRDVVDFVENTVFGPSSEKVTNDGRLEILRRIIKLLRSKNSDAQAIKRVEELREHLEFVLNCALPKLSTIGSEESDHLRELILSAKSQLPGLNYYRDLFAGMLMCQVSSTKEVIQFAEALKHRDSVVLGFHKALHQTAADSASTGSAESWQLFQRLVEEAADFHDAKSIVQALCELLLTPVIRRKLGQEIVQLLRDKVGSSEETCKLVRDQARRLLESKCGVAKDLSEQSGFREIILSMGTHSDSLISSAEALLLLELVEPADQNHSNWSTWLSVMKNHGKLLNETVLKLIQEDFMSMEFAKSCCDVFRNDDPHLAFSVAILCAAKDPARAENNEIDSGRWNDTLLLIEPLLRSANLQADAILPAAIDLIVRKRLVSSFAASFLYDSLIDHLQNIADEPDLWRMTAEDLYTAGYPHQAAYLLGEIEEVHPSLRTFDMFSRYFQIKFD